MSNRGPAIGPAIYVARDGVSHLACIITLAEDFDVTLTVFPPMKPPEFYNRIKFDPMAGPNTAKPGTCYRW